MREFFYSVFEYDLHSGQLANEYVLPISMTSDGHPRNSYIFRVLQNTADDSPAEMAMYMWYHVLRAIPCMIGFSLQYRSLSMIKRRIAPHCNIFCASSGYSGNMNQKEMAFRGSP